MEIIQYIKKKLFIVYEKMDIHFFMKKKMILFSMKNLYFDKIIYLRSESEMINFKIGNNSNYYFSPLKFMILMILMIINLIILN